ncbi:hypothetical protein [Angustibacter luteus]|uniref:Uncharacterized protein n=1 Tax=Angustibacter luteus TaxID=658456 RepID=A0ABW1JCS0_9ACTN
MPDNTIFNFSISNPSGDGQGFVPALLRRLADAIEVEGDVDVQDITFQSAVTGGEDDLTMTVYFHRQPRRR